MNSGIRLLVVAAALLASLGGAAEATDGTRLDPYFVTAFMPGGGTLTVPQSKIASLCGDGDGCTLRLVQESNNPEGLNPEMLNRQWSLATDASGVVWGVHESAGVYLTGSLDDALADILMTVPSANGVCHFRELGLNPSSYKLVPDPNPDDNVNSCTLRVED